MQCCMRLILIVGLFVVNASLVACAPQSTLQDECGHTLYKPTGFFQRHFGNDSFLKKFLKHWIPFTSNRVKMQFYLYKHDFPECGRQIKIDDVETLQASTFDADHPTRVIIHGWMTQSKGSLGRDVKDAYLSLTGVKPKNKTKKSKTQEVSNETTELDGTTSEVPPQLSATPPTEEEEEENIAQSSSPPYNYTDFNIIVVDWSVVSSNINYFGVVDLIEDLGFLLAEFLRFLHLRAGLNFNDVYLIGHSLGAQIAGSTGKQIQPYRINTIFALDPAGPKFRDLSDEFRIDPSDAEYVESIQTSNTLGFKEPVGHATFYPNFGHDQKKCYKFGCSHRRAYGYFAESITSKKGFWGTLCQRRAEDKWLLSNSGVEFRMGGEPSTPKRGTFYLKTNSEPPYALGRRRDRKDGRQFSPDVIVTVNGTVITTVPAEAVTKVPTN